MPIVWDDDKAEKNLRKHGISFDEAAFLLDQDRIDFKANVKGEPRTKTITRYRGHYFAIIFTIRGNDLRIISARRATEKERSCYDRYLNG